MDWIVYQPTISVGIDNASAKDTAPLKPPHIITFLVVMSTLSTIGKLVSSGIQPYTTIARAKVAATIPINMANHWPVNIETVMVTPTKINKTAFEM